MEKTMIFPADNGRTASWAKKKIKVPAWLKKIKSNEVGAFAMGLASYNLLFVKLKNGLPVPADDTPADGAENSPVPSQEEMYQQIQENAQVATNVNDDMSFGEAFQASRQELGAGNFFWWKGRLYNNYTEEEWNGLSETQQVEFVQQAGHFDNDQMTLDHTPDTANEPGAVGHRDQNEITENAEYVNNTENDTSETMDDNFISQQNNTPQMEYIDTDHDGKDDTILINSDDDPQAEAIISSNDSIDYALVDTDNTGMLDTIYFLDQDGNPYNSMPLEEEIPAPKLTREQLMDLNKDGVIDSIAYDETGDDHADKIYTDLNNDGSYDVAYFDTDGNGSLDAMCKMQDGHFSSDLIAMNEPFESPIVTAVVGDISSGGHHDGQSLSDAFHHDHAPETTTDEGHEHGEKDDHVHDDHVVEGLDPNEDIGEFF